MQPPPQRLPPTDPGMVGAAARIPPAVPDHVLLGLIGEGSYGEVWLARNVIGTFRAVKVVYRRRFDDHRPYEREFAGIQRFEPVSRTHDGLVDILQVGRDDAAGYFYYVMELADDALGIPNDECRNPKEIQRSNDEGHFQVTQASTSAIPGTSKTGQSPVYKPATLGSEITRCGRVPFEEAVPLCLSLTSALAHLHKHGLIHRDIKPSNIIFVRGQAKLADIGLVSEAGQSASYVGTEGYIPPEGPGTRQADLFSLGKVFYELATGKDRTEFPSLPIEAFEPEQHTGLLELNAVFTRACAGDVRHRYLTAEEMLADLALLQGGKSVKRMRTIERRLAQATRVGLAAAALFFVATAAYVFTHHQARIAQENFQRAESNRLRAERAEQKGLEQLCRAYLEQARAGRRSPLAGRRQESLEAIRKAVAIADPKDSQLWLELRNEAVAALALTDIRPAPSPAHMITATQWRPWDATLERCLDIGGDGSVRIWRLRDHELLLTLPGGVQGPLLGSEFSPDGKYIQVVLSDHRFQVWDLQQKQVIFTNGIEPQAWLWEFAPDSRQLALGFTNGLLVMREIVSGKTNLVLNLPADFRDFKFRPDGRAFVIWRSRAKSLEVRDAESGELIRAWPYDQRLREFSWSPSGKRLVTAGRDLTCQVWETDREACLQTIRGHASIVVGASFLGSDDLVASTSWDVTFRVWSVPNGREVLELRGAGDRFGYDPTTGRLGLLSRKGGQSELALYDVNAGPVSRQLWERADQAANGPWSVSFSPDEHWLASGSADGARVWELATGREAAHLDGPLTPMVAFASDGGSLITSGGQQVSSWPIRRPVGGGLSNGEVEVELGPPVALATKPAQVPFAHASATSRGDLFVACEGGPIGHFRSGTNVTNLPGSEGAHYITTSPNGEWVAAGFRFHSVARLWRTRDGAPVREFPLGSAAEVDFSPDNRWLVTGSAEEFRFWDVTSGAPGVSVRREPTSTIPGPCAFSHDGKVLAVALGQWLVALVDPASGRELARLDHYDSQIITALAFSPSGMQLAVATQGHVIQLWDLRRLRSDLAAMNLDWNQPPFASPADPVRSSPLNILSR